MVDGIQIKVCGLTSLVDAEFADACGVDYLDAVVRERLLREQIRLRGTRGRSCQVGRCS